MFKKFFILINIFAILVPSVIFADGMMIAPPNRYIFETDQKAVIFFEDGLETLIISVSFKGDTDDFAWVVPTPSRPEVEKSSKEIFTALRELTEIQENYPRAAGFGLDLISEKNMELVHVLEEKKIEYYDIAVLAADDKDALADWLNENGYHFPKQYSYILDSYIQNKWFFTAVKISKDVRKNLDQDMWSGSLIPLQFKFLTNRPVYPLKISSVIEEPSPRENKPNYINGILETDKAIEINKNEKISFYSNDFNAQEGTIEMIVKIDQKDNEQANAIFLTVSNKNESDPYFYFGAQGGMLQLYYIYDKPFGNSKPIVWNAGFSGRKLDFSNLWNNVAVSWKHGEVPKFYFNGNLLPIAQSSNKVIPKVFDDKNVNKQIYIGGSKFNNPSKSIYVDGIKISSVYKTDDEQKNDRFNLGSAKKFYFDESTIMFASFNENLNYLNKKSIVKKLNYYNSNSPKITNYNKPSQVGIELYIFTPDKEQVLPGFQTRYAAWTDKKVIENLAFNDNGEPWIKVKEDKYYLTKLSRYMKYSEMDSDLFFRDAEKNSDIIIDMQKSKTFFYIIITLSILFLIILFPILIYQFYKKD
ncbi:DUF2330 domain-containing protein [Candidatus Parcubacteria bacterium]|nr:DUF2330 domain-containing protein [Candidatus Parcubacteria bacterium]